MSQEISNNKSYFVIFALSIAIVLMASMMYANPLKTSGQTEEHTIYMSGSAERSVVPDTASLSIGVVVQLPTAKEASEENAVLMSAVISELKALGLQDKEIKTSYVSVSPVYNYETGRTIEAYYASNEVQVTSKNLENLSDIIDRSTTAGANQIGGISFSVSDEKQKELRDELLQEAVEDASSKASKLAEELNVKIIGVKTSSISESRGSQPFYAEMAMADQKVATPIQPGETTVSLSVQVTYIIE
ncbi:MAG: SIMPL domain-containing protein [Methanosarcinaceae archaeon]|nr:SIMPL domain-containing protein [Methanosarcinaceae archaeon]